ncbi:MAG: type II secretion system protein [Phycisphaerae bacterium]
MSKVPSKSSGVRPGFTLIELLVVIAIIALLVSILLPTLVSARDLARTMKCSTQMGNFAKQAHFYMSDFDGWVPTDDYNKAKQGLFWPTALSGYLTDEQLTINEVRDQEFVEQWLFDHPFFTCPSMEAPGTKPGVDYAVNNFDWEAYLYHRSRGRGLEYGNLYKRRDGISGKNPGAKRLQMIKAPMSELCYIPEASRREHIKFIDMHSDSHTTFNRWGETKGGRMIKHNSTRHQGKTTIACFDGHAEQRDLTFEDLPMRTFLPFHPAP